MQGKTPMNMPVRTTGICFFCVCGFQVVDKKNKVYDIK